MPNAHIAPLLIVDRWLSTGFVRFSNLPVSLWPLCKGRRPLQGVVRLAPFPHIPGGGGGDAIVQDFQEIRCIHPCPVQIWFPGARRYPLSASLMLLPRALLTRQDPSLKKQHSTRSWNGNRARSNSARIVEGTKQMQKSALMAEATQQHTDEVEGNQVKMHTHG